MGKTRKNVSDLESLRDEDGRISVEDFNRYIDAISEAEYEAGREARAEAIAKRKTAADELITLGLSEQSAYLLAGYSGEETQ